jgi:SAM-dependent methyltransferase
MSSYPRHLNLGSGKDFRQDCLNADIQAIKNPDWVLDITKVPWGETISTRFGEIKVEQGMFDSITANDVLEHIPDLVKAMTNCKDLLVEGGEFHIHVPYDLSLGAWQDPTHVRAFNENSWLYYTDWHWYLGWKDKFVVKELQLVKSKLAEEMNISDQMLTILPRMVDSMKVVLVKSVVE